MASRNNALAVNSKTIETVYREYLNGDYGVNRRYQRKLVWTVQEKQRLIDSILNRYPLPQFLVAEAEVDGKYRFEIIDGMQRLNAIIAFIENEFPFQGSYFDLESLASTKKLRDEGDLKQATPILDRGKSVDIATYEIAVSTYRSVDTASVEEVFRRINSSGQKLSSQDLRQAGSTSPVADLVRDLSSQLRGDYSKSTVVPLSGMKAISISSAYNEYGISPDDMFWVRHGILRRSDVRSSGDEQLVLDIVADMLFYPLLGAETSVRDALFQVENSSIPGYISNRVKEELDDPSWLSGKKERLTRQFNATFERVCEIIDQIPDDSTFKKHIGTTGNNPVPRYFEVLFSAVYQTMFRDGKDLTNPCLAAQLLKDARPFSQMPSGGGRWPGDKKSEVIDGLKDLMVHAFSKPYCEDSPDRLKLTMTSNSFMNLVSGALLETAGRDMKQGFLSLSPRSRKFDEASFEKIVKTLTAISNTLPRDGGHILVGVADNEADAERINELDKVPIQKYRGLYIVGVERELVHTGSTLDEYWNRVMKKLGKSSKLPDHYASRAVAESQIAVYNGLKIFVLRAPSIDSPVPYDGRYFYRSSSNTEEVSDQVQFGMDFTTRLAAE